MISEKDHTRGSSLYSPPAKGGRPKGGGVKSARSNHPGATRHPSLSKEGNPYPPTPDFPV